MTTSEKLTTLDALIERVERATGPDRVLDGLIARDVEGKSFGLCGDEGWSCGTRGCTGCGEPLGLHDERHSYPRDWRDDDRLAPVTASVDAAIALLDIVLPGWFWRAGRMTAPHWERGQYQPYWSHVQRTHADHCDRADEATGYAQSAPLAIILATLRALRQE